MRRWLAMLFVVGCGSDEPDATTDAATVPDGSTSTCPVGQWCIEPVPVAATLLDAVWAVSSDDVFVVGDAGTILRRVSGTWTAMQSNTTQNLRGVWAASASDVWAVGEAGTVMRFDGSIWSAQAGVAIDLDAVWGASKDDVYLVGTGTVVHWNGSSFTPQAIPGAPFAISGTSGTDIWVTGESSRVSHYTGTWTTGIDPGAGSTYFAILALSANDVWVTTFVPGKETLQFDGGTWTARSAAGSAFQALYAIGPDDIWAAGGTKAGHWDGTSWMTETPAGASAQFWGAHGAGTAFWIVGSDSLVLHRE